MQCFYAYNVTSPLYANTLLLKNEEKKAKLMEYSALWNMKFKTCIQSFSSNGLTIYMEMTKKVLGKTMTSNAHCSDIICPIELKLYEHA